MKQLKVDKTTEMETFLKVATTGSLSAAGKQMGLTPSAVSRMMTRLETRLGVRLIVRTTRHLHLTSEGEAYALASRRILNDLEETESAIANRARPSGLLKISTAAAHSRLTMVPLYQEFLERYPDIKLEIEVSDLISDVEGGHIDVAIRFGQLPDSNLSARRLGDTGRTIVATPNYLAKAGMPKTPADLEQHNCLDFSFNRLEPGWPMCDEGRHYILPISGNMIANNGDTLVELAMQDIGITRVGNFHIENAIKSGELIPLLEDYNPQDKEVIHAVFIGGQHMPERVRVFIDYLVEKLSS